MKDWKEDMSKFDRLKMTDEEIQQDIYRDIEKRNIRESGKCNHFFQNLGQWTGDHWETYRKCIYCDHSESCHFGISSSCYKRLDMTHDFIEGQEISKAGQIISYKRCLNCGQEYSAPQGKEFWKQAT